MKNQLYKSWNNLTEKLLEWLNAVITNLPNFILAVVVFVLAYWLSGYLQTWSNTYLKKFIKQTTIRGLVAKAIAILTIALGLVLALSVMRLDGTLNSLLAGAGVAGLAISLALQGTLSNTFSGVFIALKEELKVGDWVETNGFTGRVTGVDLRNTKIKESDNNIVVLPNKMILENPFKNYGLTKRIRATINCGVAYESNLEQVQNVAINAIQEVFPSQEDESIEFYYTEFGSSSIDFMLRFWVDANEKITALEVKSKAIVQIKNKFDSVGIDIPYPIRKIAYVNETK